MIELLKLLSPIYKDKTQWLVAEINKVVTPSQTSTSTDWYKSANLYVTYPEAFDINGAHSLSTLAERVPYIRKLGFNALHILPFLDSPLIDGGFDIKSYVDVRKDLGGMPALDQVLEQTDKEGIKVFMDLIMNHISDQHEWFQKATAGDGKYRNYFLNREEKPVLVRRYEDEQGHWAEYDLDGKISSIRIIFPQFEKELPHWVQGSDGYWYYHTFYQYQPDLDWYNPAVFLEFIKILKFWADKGMNFRLDAITFMAKDIKSGEVESNPNLHLILQALNSVLNDINPEAVFIAETCQPIETIKKYFGTTEVVESKIVYNFKLMQSIWYAYVTHDLSFINETLMENFLNTPPHATWVNFLRNHDELTLEFAPDSVRAKLYESLLPKGRAFREGFGVAGRTFNFVDLKSENLVFIYKVLASLPGIAAIVYGDEVGQKNDLDNIVNLVKYKTEVLGLSNVGEDTRDLNRGILFEQEIESGLEIYKQIAYIFNQRLEYSDFFKQKPQNILEKDNLFLTYSNSDGRKLEIKINFSEQICEWKLV